MDRRRRSLLPGLVLAASLLAFGPGSAAAQAPAVSWGLVASPGSPAPIEVGGTFTGLLPPDISPDGFVVFKGFVGGATDPVCSAGCGGLFEAEPDVDCTFFSAPRRIFPLINRVLLEGDSAPIGTHRSLDAAPSVSGPLLHTSCFGLAGPEDEAVFARLRPIDQTATSGLPCGSQFSSPSANLAGAAYWRSLIEAVVFHTLDAGPPQNLAVSGAPTNTRVGGAFFNLAKTRSLGWETLPRRVGVSDDQTVAFLASVAGVDTSPECLGTDLFCDAIFVVDRLSGLAAVAVARNDPLATGGAIARFCGPPAVAEGGVVTFRALTDPAGDCDPALGSGQGIYVITPPFLPGSAKVVADGSVPLPDGLGGTWGTTVFSDPGIALTGTIFFRAGAPGAGAGPAVVIRAAVPYGALDLAAIARKDGAALPDQGVFSSFDPGRLSANRREEVALRTGEGIFVASPIPVVIEDCLDAIAECRQVIVSGGGTLVAAETRALQSCYGRIAAGKIAPLDCRTADQRAVRRISRVRAAVSRHITRLCSNDLIPHVGACNRNDPTVAGEVDCLITTHAAEVDSILQALVPQVPQE
jgi:hypothetical protein